MEKRSKLVIYLFFHCLETAAHWGLELELGI